MCLTRWASVPFIEEGERGPQAGGALHGILFAVAFQVLGETIDWARVKLRLFAGRVDFLCPVSGKGFQPTAYYFILVVAALLIVQHFARAFNIGRQYRLCCV